jgi:hypothetical protein
VTEQPQQTHLPRTAHLEHHAIPDTAPETTP